MRKAHRLSVFNPFLLAVTGQASFSALFGAEDECLSAFEGAGEGLSEGQCGLAAAVDRLGNCAAVEVIQGAMATGRAAGGAGEGRKSGLLGFA